MCDPRVSTHCGRLCCSLLLLMAFVITAGVRAQTVTGNISGTVTDPSGAVVVGATVTAHNMATGVDTTVTTNDAGLYVVRFLPIGQYQVTVQASGFGTQTIPVFSLEIGQIAKFNVTLQAGSTAQTVEVSAAAPILNTNDPTLGVTFTSNEIKNVPLNGLNFASVTLYLPGATTTNGPVGFSGNNAIERNTYYSGMPNINGQRAQANNFTLDGIDNNEPQNNLIAINPSPYAIQEMKVISANAPAEYGNVNGGDVISVLKSGTNEFHGDAFWFLQNDNMNANSWGNNHAVPIIKKNPYTQSQFGGDIGGPILRDKLFFFADYIGAREHTGGTGQYSVFTAAMRNGDFSEVLNPPVGPGGVQNTPIQLYDTQNNFAPYANNQIQVINPVAKFLFAHPTLYPLPNATPSDGVAANNFQGPSRSFTVNNQFDAKLEWDLRAADKITGFYGQSHPYDGSIPVLQIQFPPQNRFPTNIGGATWVHIFSPAIVNSARVGFTRVFWIQSEPTDPSGQFGLTGNAKVGIPFGTQTFPGYSYQSIGSGPNAGGTTAQDGSIIDNTYSYVDDLTWQHGLHLFSIGIQALRYQNNYITSNNNGFLGSLSYSGDFTGNPGVNGISSPGYGAADFALDRVSTAQVTSQGVFVGQRQWRTAVFFQDDWKIRPNLTLNLGLRYEYDQPWYEVNNKTGNVLLDTNTVIYAHSIPAQAPTGAQLCQNRACYNPNHTQFMPRLGFAFQATDRFVIRGGYGATSFFEGNAGNQRLTSIVPFIQSTATPEIKPTAAGGGGQPRTAEDGFSSSPSDISYSGSQYALWPQNIQPAYIQEWSLTTEYALSGSTSLQVGYLGEQGQHIMDYGNANQWLVPNDPTSGLHETVGVGSPLGSVGSGGLLITESRAMMNYNALQAVLRHRATHGLEYTLNYSYGKAMTNSLGNYALNVSGFGGAFQNYFDSHSDYGPAGYDVTHNFSGLLVYALPVGRGKEFASGVNRVADALIGGWSVSGAGVAYSGFPATVTGGNINVNSYGVQRANQYRHIKVVGRSLANWYGIDPSAMACGYGLLKNDVPPGVDNGVCAFGKPSSTLFGTGRNGSLRAPDFKQIDASAFKDFHITERHTIGFRADAFNVFNIASYGNPDTGAGDSTFGQDEQARSPNQRTLQLSLHYSF